MPTPCYISIEGQTQGLITAGACTADSIGDSFVEGHEDEMLVQQFDHVVTVPTDPQSGQPSGQRVHKPFKFTVALNKAVPLLYNALSSIHCEMPHCQDPAKSDFTQNVTVSLSYRKITWDHVNAGTSGSDDWRKPIEA
ncbi:Hemolysin co-regulated protein [Vibrio cholerae]|nr:Hemolysin co-regulated protein [Vibrio cholerae]